MKLCIWVLVYLKTASIMLTVALKLVGERFTHYSRLVYVKGVYHLVILLIYGRLHFNQFYYMPHKVCLFVGLIV